MWLLSRRFQRVTPVLLIAAIGLLVVSVILQGIMCATVLRFHSKPIPANVTNSEVPVNVENADLDVNVTNWEVDVKLHNHDIVAGDPIPVTIVR